MTGAGITIAVTAIGADAIGIVVGTAVGIVAGTAATMAVGAASAGGGTVDVDPIWAVAGAAISS